MESLRPLHVYFWHVLRMTHTTSTRTAGCVTDNKMSKARLFNSVEPSRYAVFPFQESYVAVRGGF